jgi:hypothetical protein
VTIGGVTSLSSIRICLELERVGTWKEHTTRNGPTKISQDTNEMTIVELSGSGDKLNQNVHNI